MRKCLAHKSSSACEFFPNSSPPARRDSTTSRAGQSAVLETHCEKFELSAGLYILSDGVCPTTELWAHGGATAYSLPADYFFIPQLRPPTTGHCLREHPSRWWILVWSGRAIRGQDGVLLLPVEREFVSSFIAVRASFPSVYPCKRRPTKSQSYGRRNLRSRKQQSCPRKVEGPVQVGRHGSALLPHSSRADVFSPDQDGPPFATVVSTRPCLVLVVVLGPTPKNDIPALVLGSLGYSRGPHPSL